MCPPIVIMFPGSARVGTAVSSATLRTRAMLTHFSFHADSGRSIRRSSAPSGPRCTAGRIRNLETWCKVSTSLVAAISGFICLAGLCGPCSAISLLCCVTDIAEERILEPWNRVSRSASRSLGRAWNGAPPGRVSGVLCGVEAVGPCGRDVVSHSSWPLHPEVVTSLPHRRPSPVATSKYM